MIPDNRKRARLRLDERLSTLRPVERLAPPPKGWVRAIRDALGMTGGQLADRLGVRAQTVDALERSEAGGSVKLETLRRAAEALDCHLVYALVPRSSLDGMVRERAREIALRDLARVAHTMKLEDQQTGDADVEARLDAYMRDVLRERDLWTR